MTATVLFIQKLIEANDKENSKASLYCPSMMGILTERAIIAKNVPMP